ncbi:polysaccharide pyruvyl transferase family protein [Kocuria rosea]|uniref:polysaccharide pyruvyl transferase family protein n=1 Tax=Kocuria rosea TaxID=1275 RepID=UPI0009E93709|nr:polysaccharide pyruvyl transferase family protein [Kocuria polaris]
MKVLIAHAYSAENRGDGLLVEETVNMVRQAYGPETEFAVVASYPQSFAHLGFPMYNSRPSRLGYDLKYLQLLLSRAKEYDAIVSVGGGFLRGKTWIEATKTILVHGPQALLSASRRNASVYLPQSIGPFSPVLWVAIRSILRRLGVVWLRDDKSVAELQLPNARRAPDLAVLGMARRRRPFDLRNRVVMSVRHVNGELTRPVKELRDQLGSVDSYVQSDVSSNSDVHAVQELLPRRILEYSELMTHNQESRVVVAVRLHAALMALAAGHYVIHLAYERKGFGAFNDLELSDYVHNVNNFDPALVLRQIQTLQNDPSSRDCYEQRLLGQLELHNAKNAKIIESLRDIRGVTQK